MNKFLALYLDGPMQSWGYMSKFDRRTTLGFPTKSGIAGMICAAMGIEKADTAKLAEIANLNMMVYVLSDRERKTEIRRITDFHTVGGGFDEKKSAYENQSIVRNAKGKPGNTVVTRREYLLDAKFAVILSGEDALLEKMDTALRNPKWGVWLGRKSCIPVAPVAQGCHESQEKSLAAVKEAYKKMHGKECEFRKTISDVASFAEGSDSYMDVPLDFGKREFSVRRISAE